jgi:5-methylcytosine-specific restriction protein A
MVHNAGWIVRIHDGFPEFIPPTWLDADQTPRRKPHPVKPGGGSGSLAPR